MEILPFFNIWELVSSLVFSSISFYSLSRTIDLLNGIQINTKMSWFGVYFSAFIWLKLYACDIASYELSDFSYFPFYWHFFLVHVTKCSPKKARIEALQPRAKTIKHPCTSCKPRTDAWANWKEKISDWLVWSLYINFIEIKHCLFHILSFKLKLKVKCSFF